MFFKRRSDKIDALTRVPLFQNLSKRDLEHVARVADELEIKPGEVLMRQGDQGREFFLIAKGRIRIERNGEIVARLGPDEFVGEMALLDGKERSATAIAEEPSTVLVLHWGRFWPLLETMPGVQRKMLIGLSGRIRDLHDSHTH